MHKSAAKGKGALAKSVPRHGTAGNCPLFLKTPVGGAGVALKSVDLFCGCGGLSAGLIDAGIQVVSAYDHWLPAVETYNRNIAPHAHQFDLTDVAAIVERINTFAPDLIAGGPPCQDFSTAGKREEGKRANLTLIFGEIISKVLPRFFLMENVPQARLSRSYRMMRQNLTAAGYALSETVLDASYCGVPQARKRFIVFGSHADSKSRCEKFAHWVGDHKSRRQLTVKEYLKSEIDIEFYYRHPRNYSRRSIFTVHEPSPTIRGVNRPVPPNYKGNHLDSADPARVRPLTSRERSRIQTFPKNWDWNAADRNADVETQIGNAVPVRMASFVADGVRYAALLCTRLPPPP